MLLLDAGWILVKTLSWGSLTAILTGVAVFGWYFVRINASAARRDSNDIPPESWRGPGAIMGLCILAGGAGLQVAAIVIAALLPGRA